MALEPTRNQRARAAPIGGSASTLLADEAGGSPIASLSHIKVQINLE
jgi:hypothetical protein